MTFKSVSTKILVLLLLAATTGLVALYSQNLNLVARNEVRLKGSEIEVDLSASPNPFDTFTVITATVPESLRGSVIISDQNHNVVNELYNGEFVEGKNNFTWDGKDFAGDQLSPGRYICEVTLGTRYTSRTIILILK